MKPNRIEQTPLTVAIASGLTIKTSELLKTNSAHESCWTCPLAGKSSPPKAPKLKTMFPAASLDMLPAAVTDWQVTPGEGHAWQDPVPGSRHCASVQLLFASERSEPSVIASIFA